MQRYESKTLRKQLLVEFSEKTRQKDRESVYHEEMLQNRKTQMFKNYQQLSPKIYIQRNNL